MDVEAMIAKALAGKWFTMPEIDPWAPRRVAPELKNIKPVLALPAPVTEDRDFLFVASDDMRTYDDRRITLEGIMVAVSVATQVTVGDIKSARRSHKIVVARHIYFWIARNYTGKSFPSIGRFCGYKDHSTVMNGVARVEADMPAYSDAIARATGLMNYRKRR